MSPRKKALSIRTLKAQNAKARKLIEKARETIELVAYNERRTASKAERYAIDAEVDKWFSILDALETQNNEALEGIRRIEETKTEAFEPYLHATLDLAIRGYWDAYPKVDQRRHHKNYSHIPKEWRDGQTAYDQIAELYGSLTKFEREHLEVRVAYGMNPQTGKLLPTTLRALEAQGFVIRPVSDDRDEAIAGIVKLMVRGDYIDTPRGYSKAKREKMKKKGGRTRTDALSPIPLGLEFWIVPSEPQGELFT